jgi:hypothetical protein
MTGGDADLIVREISTMTALELHMAVEGLMTTERAEFGLALQGQKPLLKADEAENQWTRVCHDIACMEYALGELPHIHYPRS